MSFRIRLLIGAAVPMALASPAIAQVSISTATTAPVSTATANAGAPAADVTITPAGSITLPAAAGSTALTINSNTRVTNSGAIAVPNSDNAVGVRISPNVTGGYAGAGQINLLEDYVRTDTDADNDLDGPLAQGTGRIGLLLEPGGTHTGDITVNLGGAVTVEGNNSFGLSLRSALQGSLAQGGSVNVTGTNAIGVDIREDVSGDVTIGVSTLSGTSNASGTVLATGENAIAVNVLGDVAGEFEIDGAVLATGFTSTSITNYADPDTIGSGPPIAQRRDADDLLIGGPAVAIRGDLARGFLANGAAVGGADPTETVKDVIQDFNENRVAASISAFGSAPAVLVQSLDGAAGDAIRLGLVRESVRDTLDDDDDDNLSEIIGVFNYDFGFINRGNIVGNGLNIGFAGTGVRFAGSADGLHATTIDGGVFNGGAIAASGFEANAVGVSFGAGASTPQLVNNGSITSTVLTETNHDAYAVLVDAGATLPTVVNNGALTANVRGYDGDAVAFRDLSGTVTSFSNSSRIVTAYADDDTTDTITSGLGRAIAIDLSRATAGVTLTQSDVSDNARIFGDILLGSGGDRFNLRSGEVAGDVNFGTGSDTLAIDSARLFGDATFGGAGAAVSLTNGAVMFGDLALGSATGSLSVAGDSIFDGAVTRTAGSGPFSLTVNDADFNNRGTGTLNVSSMALANQARVGFVINDARIASGAPIFNITGVADIAANTVFTPVFEQFTTQPFTLRVLTANTLNLGGPVEQMLNASSPFLYNVSLTRPAGTNALDLSLRVKTAAELGLNTRSASALAGVLNLLENDDDIAAALTSIASGPEFTRAASDLLPAQDGALMQILASNSTAAFGATAQRLDMLTRKPDAPGGAWIEEYGVYHEADADADALGVSGGGFGVAAGLDLIATRDWVLGGFVALESVEMDEQGRTGAPLNVSQTTVGGYGGWKLGGLALNGAASYGFADLSSDREVVVGTITDRLRGSWSGNTLSAGARATYSLPLGFLELTPYASVDYASLNQDAYEETAGTADGLALIVESGEASLATAGFGAALSADLGVGSGGGLALRPEISAGYRTILNYEGPSSTVRFAGGSANSAFALDPGQEPDDAIVAGLGLNLSGEYVNVKFGYDAEIADGAITHYGAITLRLAFW